MFNYDWNWSVIWMYRLVFLEGLGVTFALTLTAVTVGGIIGLALGGSASRLLGFSTMIRSPVLFYIDCVKALPPLILLLLFYYWLPYVLGIKSSFWLAAIALAVNISAFVADVFRHAIDGVPRPLVDAGYAVGMTDRMVAWYIVTPEAMRSVVPTFGLFAIDVFKLSSLASVIAVGELVHRASEISTYSYRFLEVYAALAGIYLVVLLPFSYFIRRLESTERFIRRS